VTSANAEIPTRLTCLLDFQLTDSTGGQFYGSGSQLTGQVEIAGPDSDGYYQGKFERRVNLEFAGLTHEFEFRANLAFHDASTPESGKLVNYQIHQFIDGALTGFFFGYERGKFGIKTMTTMGQRMTLKSTVGGTSTEIVATPAASLSCYLK
jgi:hypothetical protein